MKILILFYSALENLGVRTLESITSNEDKLAEEILCNTTKKKDCYYETGLLWRTDYFDRKDSYSMAINSFYNMETKMS